MKIHLDNNNEYSNIDFCCTKMANAVMKLKIIKAQQYSRLFSFKGYIISHCPFCGNKILWYKTR